MAGSGTGSGGGLGPGTIPALPLPSDSSEHSDKLVEAAPLNARIARERACKFLDALASFGPKLGPSADRIAPRHEKSPDFASKAAHLDFRPRFSAIVLIALALAVGGSGWGQAGSKSQRKSVSVTHIL